MSTIESDPVRVELEARAVVGAILGQQPVTCRRLKAGKSDVFLLAGGGAGPVVAKRAAAETIAVEFTVLKWLAGAPFPAVQPRGTVPADTGPRAWLVSDFADGDPYDSRQPDHARLAGVWLAELHRWSTTNKPPSLPSRGRSYHAGVLRAALETLAESLQYGPALTRPERESIRQMSDALAAVLDGWAGFSAALDRLPDAVVHSGIAGKNVRVSRVGAPAVLAFDWEQAGWGCPAADLSKVDLASYSARRGRALAGLDEARSVGEVLWCAAAIPGERANLLGEWPHRAAAKVEYYLDRVNEALPRLVDGPR